MGLTTVFGINGVGKDTIAEGIIKNHPEIRVTSMSRLLMYSLGISKTCNINEKISEEQYKILEKTPQSIIVDIENKQYKQLLERMANSSEKVIFLSHLVSALRLEGDTKYLTDKKIPDWLIEINDNLIQLVAPVHIISERRKQDISRKREIDTYQILKHQELCSKEWQRIKMLNPDQEYKMHIVQNIDLNKAISEVEEIIYGRNKKLPLINNTNVEINLNSKESEDDDYSR